MSGLGRKNADEVAYMLEFNDDKTQVRLTLFTGAPIKAIEYLQALSVYIEDFADSPESCFQFASDLPDERH